MAEDFSRLLKRSVNEVILAEAAAEKAHMNLEGYGDYGDTSGILTSAEKKCLAKALKALSYAREALDDAYYELDKLPVGFDRR